MRQDGDALMERVRLGDEAAFEQLVLAYRAWAMHRARLIVRDGALAEDVAQECFVDVWLSRGRYKTGFRFESYLGCLVRRRAIDTLRKRRDLYQREMPELPDGDTPEARFVRMDGMLRLSRALDNLPAGQGEMLRLFAVEGLSYAQIARRTGKTVGQVKIALNRARKKLREAYKS